MVQIKVLKVRMVAESFTNCKMIVFLHANEVEGLEVYLSR